MPNTSSPSGPPPNEVASERRFAGRQAIEPGTNTLGRTLALAALARALGRQAAEQAWDAHRKSTIQKALNHE